MLSWLESEPATVCYSESRILVAAHEFMRQVDRFRRLNGAGRDVAVGALRRLVTSYYATDAFIWKKTLVDKEPLGPVNLPDGDYVEFLDHVRAVFPDSRQLLMIRDPLATVSSMVARKWGYSLRSGGLEELSLDRAIGIWNASAEIALERVGTPSTYVCVFERLISDPARESASIWRFLSIDSHRVFTPHATSGSPLSASEQGHVVANTADLYQRIVSESANTSQ
jgi:hypothetical protein